LSDPNQNTLVVGLTGGIACGKSSVSKRFEALGVPVSDADRIARELVAPGSEALAAIVARFGATMLQADATLDRAALRKTAFASTPQRRALEAIMHPRIQQAIVQRVANTRAPYHMIVVPLLVESPQLQAIVDRTLVVDLDRDTQIKRLMARDHISRSMAESMLNAQASRSARLALADDIIDNNREESQLDASVLALHRCYLDRSTRKFRLRDALKR